MLYNKLQIFSQPRVTKAVLGVTEDEFYQLLPVFSQCLHDRRIQLRPHRQRKIGGGRRGDLPEDEDKLLYILLYLKLYPTYDALAVLCDHYRSKWGDSVKFLLPVLALLEILGFLHPPFRTVHENVLDLGMLGEDLLQTVAVAFGQDQLPTERHF